MRERLFRKIGYWSARYPVRMIVSAILMTIIAGGLSERLTLSMHFKNLMPAYHPMVKEFDRIMEDYATASMIIVAATGPEQELKAYVNQVAPRLKAMRAFVQRVDYKMEESFFLNHGLMLQKVKDLKKSRHLFSKFDLVTWLAHLNDNFEETYIADEESLSTSTKENEAIRNLDALEFVLRTMIGYGEGVLTDSKSAELAAKKFCIGDPYFISQDKDMILLFAQPTFTIDEIDKVIKAENKIDSMLLAEAHHFPGVDVGTTGTMALSRDETEAANSDMYWTTIIAMILIVGLFVVSFRMWISPIMAGLVLLVGISWTAGFTALTIGTLNIMTSMFSVVLIGLGVDFSIHLISLYTEMRGGGESPEQAISDTLIKAGGGVVTGALSTSLAFFTLMISETAGMSEFGMVAGSGVFFCLLATIWVLPPLLVIRDRVMQRFRKEKYAIQITRFSLMGKWVQLIQSHHMGTFLFLIGVTIVFGISAVKITFDYNYLNMEPLGLKSLKLQHLMEDKFHITPDFAVVTANSPEESYTLAEKAKKLKMIGMVTSISDYVPPVSKQKKRQKLLEEIKQLSMANIRHPKLTKKDKEKLLTELRRLRSNIIEISQLAYLGGQDRVDRQCKRLIGDMDNETQGFLDSILLKFDNGNVGMANLSKFSIPFFASLKKIVRKMANPAIITVEQLPASIKNQFVSRSGHKYLISIYPKQSVWNLAFLERFTHQMEKISPRVTGMPLVFYVLIDILGSDGIKAAVAALVVIFLLLLIDFRNLRYAVLAIVPLVMGGIWMLGMMNLVGLQLTMVNVMGLPLILGIGVDDGVHIIHRFKLERSITLPHLFMSVGRAILITSLTTMLAFGSFKFATYRGLGSLGSALFIGVGACFMTTIIILPLILSWKKKGEHPNEK